MLFKFFLFVFILRPLEIEATPCLGHQASEVKAIYINNNINVVATHPTFLHYYTLCKEYESVPKY